MRTLANRICNIYRDDKQCYEQFGNDDVLPEPWNYAAPYLHAIPFPFAALSSQHPAYFASTAERAGAFTHAEDFDSYATGVGREMGREISSALSTPGKEGCSEWITDRSCILPHSVQPSEFYNFNFCEPHQTSAPYHHLWDEQLDDGSLASREASSIDAERIGTEENSESPSANTSPRSDETIISASLRTSGEKCVLVISFKGSATVNWPSWTARR